MVLDKKIMARVPENFDGVREAFIELASQAAMFEANQSEVKFMWHRATDQLEGGVPELVLRVTEVPQKMIGSK